MLFAVSAGSSGYGDERYSAYLPFSLAPGASIKADERKVGAYDLKILQLNNHYALLMGSFDTPEKASDGIEALRASLLWLSLKMSIGISYSSQFGQIQFFPDPVPVEAENQLNQYAVALGWDVVDGHYDSDKATIVPEHKRLARFETGSARVTIGLASHGVLDCMEEAHSLPHVADVASNPKLKLSIELYSAFRFEMSDNTRLITLISSLEALFPDIEVGEASQSALDEAIKTVKECRAKFKKGEHEFDELNLLMSRIGTLKREAIGTSLKKNIGGVYARNPELGDPAADLKVLTDAYNTRSNLVHDGVAPEENVKAHLSFLTGFVPKLLMAIFLETACEMS